MAPTTRTGKVRTPKPAKKKPTTVVRQKAAPKSRQLAPGRRKSAPTAQQDQVTEVYTFMQQQAAINETILQQLNDIRADKSGRAPHVSMSGESSGVGAGPSNSNNREASKRPSADKRIYQGYVDVSSNSDESDVDSETEHAIRQSLSHANDLMQPSFTKNKGTGKSLHKIEQKIKANRPYAFLDREKHRVLERNAVHPEELDLLTHLEGLAAMAMAQNAYSSVKGMITHIHQLIKDSQVHEWNKVQRWSNEVIVKNATGEWTWDSVDSIREARNSQYMIPSSVSENENALPCYRYNKGDCHSDNQHLIGVITMLHACAFCFALDGSLEPHSSRNCPKRRSSNNYFRGKEENRDVNYERRYQKAGKMKGNSHKEKTDDRFSKN